MPIAAIYGPDDFANLGRGYSAPPRSRVSPAQPARALPMPSLEWTPEVERATAHLYERVKKVIAPVEWPFMAPYVRAINELKQTRDAVILAHNYQTPEIFHCVADIVGDSLALAREAMKTDAAVIVHQLMRLNDHRSVVPAVGDDHVLARPPDGLDEIP